METTQRLTDKLHLLWDTLDADERALFAAVFERAGLEDEVAGYGRWDSIECIAFAHAVTRGFDVWQEIELVKSPRDVATGQIVSPRDVASGQSY